MILNRINLSANNVCMADLMGQPSYKNLFAEINKNSCVGSFFGSASDPFREGFQIFEERVVAPVREAAEVLREAARKMQCVDEYREINSVGDLQNGIPPCMWESVVYFEPVRRMLEDERIDGFGIDPKTLQPEDKYENIYKSGVARDIHSGTVDKDGSYEVTFIWSSEDPQLTPEEAMAITTTRDFIAEFMAADETKHIDVTDYPNLHG